MVRLLEWDDDASGDDLRLTLERAKNSCLDLRRELEALSPSDDEVVRDVRNELEVRLTRLQRLIEVHSAGLD